MNQSTTEAIASLLRLETALRRTRFALASSDLPLAKTYYGEALREADNTCAIQLDTLT